MDLPPWIRDVSAIVSASVALLALVISFANTVAIWKNYRRDKSDVDVKLQWNAEVVHEHGVRSPVKQRFGKIIVTNKGRRPVHITHIGLLLPGRNTSGNWLEQSVRLDEGDASITIKIPQNSELEPFIKEWKKIRASVGTNNGRWYDSKPGDSPPAIVSGTDFQSAVLLQDFSKIERFHQKP
jgi:hypothetical protein